MTGPRYPHRLVRGEFQLSTASLDENFAERSVVYACVLMAKNVHEAVGVLGLDGYRHFCNPLCADLFRIAIEMAVNHDHVMGDLEIFNELRRQQGGDVSEEQEADWFVILDEGRPCITSYWAARVLDNSRRRMAATAFSKLNTQVMEGVKTEEIIESGHEAFALLNIQAGVEPESSADIASRYLDHIAAIVRGDDDAQRLKTNYPSLDRLTMGYGSGNVGIIAARPGRGKTAFAINLTRTIGVDQGKHVLFFSLEMLAQELFNRLVASTGQIQMNNIYRQGFAEATEQAARETVEYLNESRIYFHDKITTSEDLRAAILAHIVRKGRPDIIIVDYLQLLTDPRVRESRQAEVASISRQIKQLAQQTGIPFIVLSQLRRLDDRETETRPKLKHLRESGAIEQDADTVLLLSRQEVEDPDLYILMADLAKNRHGDTGAFQLDLNVSTQRLSELGCTDEPY